MRRRSPKIQAHIRNRADRQLQKMAPLRDFMVKFDGPFWKLVSEKLQAKVAAFEYARSAEKLAAIPEVSLKMIMAQEEALKAVINMPNEIKAVLEKMEEEHGKTMGDAERSGALEKNRL